MNARLAAILVVLLVVLGGGALLYQYQESSQRPANSDTLGRPLLKDLKAAEVASIRIVEPKGTLTVRQKDDRWVLPERGDFPADVAKVRDFVVQALSLKVGQSEPIGDKDRARLNLDDSGTQVEFGVADGKPLPPRTSRSRSSSSARSTSSAKSTTPTRRAPTAASSRCPASRRWSTSCPTPSRRPRPRARTGSTGPRSRARKGRPPRGALPRAAAPASSATATTPTGASPGRGPTRSSR